MSDPGCASQQCHDCPMQPCCQADEPTTRAQHSKHTTSVQRCQHLEPEHNQDGNDHNILDHRAGHCFLGLVACQSFLQHSQVRDGAGPWFGCRFTQKHVCCGANTSGLFLLLSSTAGFGLLSCCRLYMNKIMAYQPRSKTVQPQHMRNMDDSRCMAACHPQKCCCAGIRRAYTTRPRVVHCEHAWPVHVGSRSAGR